MSFSKKHEIVESLQALDPSQVDKVWRYINGLAPVRSDENRSLKQRHEAMVQIRQALRKDPLAKYLF